MTHSTRKKIESQQQKIISNHSTNTYADFVAAAVDEVPTSGRRAPKPNDDAKGDGNGDTKRDVGVGATDVSVTDSADGIVSAVDVEEDEDVVER